MPDLRFPKATRELAERRRALAPEPEAAFQAFCKAAFSEGALDPRTNQLTALRRRTSSSAPGAPEAQVKAARREGARPEDIMEAIWVAAEMSAGATYAHSVKAVELIADDDGGT